MKRLTDERIAKIEEMTELEYMALMEFVEAIKRLRACGDCEKAV